MRNASILANIPLFKELDSSQLAKIASATHEISVNKGRILFNKGDPSDGFYVVISGRIKLSFVSRDGKEFIAEIFGPNQSFGEAVMFLGKPYPVCAQTLMDSKILHVPKSVVFDGVDHNSGFARRVIAGLCARLVDRIQTLEYLTVYSSIQKVIGYLLREIELAESAKNTTCNEADVLLAVNKATLAAQLNLTPETLSRVLHRLADEDLIRVEGKTIHICHVQKMRDFSG